MATRETVKNIFAMIFFKWPNRRPADTDELKLVLDVWERIYAPIPDETLMIVGQRFVAEKTGIYPTEDPFAMILEMARPRDIETQGDVFELAIEAVKTFGYMREAEAMKWLKSCSPIIAATVTRFGYQELCMNPVDQLGVARGQMMAIFKAEKERAAKFGEVFPSAVELQKGNFPALPGSVTVLKLEGLAGDVANKLSLGKKAA